MAESIVQRIRGSAAWAAYADALGFITELAGPKGVQRRIGEDEALVTQPWKRRVGGRSGPTLELPAGTTSDDTQLRLASSRSLRGDGEFDVEQFSKLELTVFPSYALGAGRGTLAAAAALRRRGATWSTNFFTGSSGNYVGGGGNGAAMRIQPHAWAGAADPSIVKTVSQVVSNAVCTHGHVRGILGAVFHAIDVREAVRGRILDPDELITVAENLRVVCEVVDSEPMLGSVWRPQWERTVGSSFEVAVGETIEEMVSDIQACTEGQLRDPQRAYREAAKRLGATNPKVRGAGTMTAILGGFAAWLFRSDPEEGVRSCANAIGTDTDSIATMAAAVLGADAGEVVPGEVLDLDYILYEATRTALMAEGHPTETFPYPDLLAWTPPKSAADVVGSVDGRPHVAGLGPAQEMDPGVRAGADGEYVWQWFRLWFGQTILAKRRGHPESLLVSQRVDAFHDYRGGSVGPNRRVDSLPEVRSADQTEPDLDDLTNRIIRSGFDPCLLGEALLELSQTQAGIEKSIALASIIAKAYRSRRSQP